MPEVQQMLQPCHGSNLHMSQTHTLNTQLPVSTIQGLALHDLTVLAKHVISNHVGTVLLSLELEEFSSGHVVQ